MNWISIFCTTLLSIGACTYVSGQTTYQTKTRRPDKQVNSRRNTGTFLYELDTSFEPYTQLTDTIAVNAGDIWDEPTYYIPIAFPFELNGHNINHLSFSGSGAELRAPTGSSFADTYVFPYETDLIDRGANGDSSLSPICYKVEGTIGNRILKLEFSNAGSYWEWHLDGSLEMYVNFQMWLYEGSNMVQFRFGPSYVNDPILFYGGLNGSKLGIKDYDDFTLETINPHYLINNPAAPVLSPDIGFLNNTPSNGTVYTLYPDLPLDVVLQGENNNSVCNPNGSITASTTGGFPPYSFLWSTGETSDSITQLNAGTYGITVTDQNNTTAVSTITLTSPDTLIADTYHTDLTSVGANDGTASVAGSGGMQPYSYLWSTGANTQMIENLAPGNYTVVLTDAAGCAISKSVTIQDFACPGLLLQSSKVAVNCNSICDGRIEITHVVNGLSPWQFLWSNGDTTALLANLCAGDYSVTVTDSAGCIITDTFHVTEPALVQAQAQSSHETILGNDGTASVTPSGGIPPYTYLWSNGSTDSLIVNLSPGEYSITLTDAHGCVDTQQVQVNAFVCFTVQPEGVLTVACHGDSTGIINAMITGGTGPYTCIWNTGDTTYQIENLSAGIYNALITDEGQGCHINFTQEITQPDSLVIVLDAVTHITDSTTASIEITITGGNPPYLLNWIGPAAYISTDEDIFNLQAGLYTLAMVDGNHCFMSDLQIEILDQTVDVQPVELPAITIAPNPACDFIEIRYPDHVQIQSSLYSLTGQLAGHWKNERRLDVSRLPAGQYILRMMTGGRTMIRQVVLQ